MRPTLSISNLTKTYASGLQALKSVSLDIAKGEIFALLGPNGAGKTTLISIVCGIVTPSSGTVSADGHDIQREFRAARRKIGLVPQELATDTFETVWATVNYSRELFGHAPNPAYIEKLLRDLELRRDMWALVRSLRENGVTIILTTHYIDEAEEMADRIGVISKGELILVEEKHALMKKLGRKELRVHLAEAMNAVPADLAQWQLALAADGTELVYGFDARQEDTGIPALLRRLGDLGIAYKDLNTRQSSLEDIFVSLVHDRSAEKNS
jgi:ABC-2 type transport system ATP-binding protein